MLQRERISATFRKISNREPSGVCKTKQKKKCKTKYQYNPMKNGIIHHSNAINVFILIKSIARKFKHTRLVTSKG